ncbi:MAG: phage terminase large subunit family protein [Alphaproteobacteria bacterium]|nr:phage terminase large subunit family protein [Alphaproteobacteria bacterium]
MGIRSFIMWFMSPAMKARVEADSRKWIATCPHCGAGTSVWDLGGIRYKAAGRPLTRFKCPACGKFGMHRVEKTG